MSSNTRFQNILDQFNSEDNDDNNITEKTKQINSKNKYNNKISENSNNENSEENIKIYYINDIPLYSDRDNNHNEESIKYNNKNMNNNNNSNKSELELKNTFRPIPIPNSPEFPKKSTLYNDNQNKKDKNNKKAFNNNYNNNNNINNNFTETLKTKIEGVNINQNQEKLITLDNIINGNKTELEHNNFVSLGPLYSKEKENNDNNSNNSKTSEEIEKQKEEEFLKNEDYKIRKIKNQNQTKEEENGKENVEDEDIHDSGEINFNINSKFEHSKFSRNKEDNNIISTTQSTVPNRIKDISKKLFIDNNNNIDNDNDKENGKKFIFNDINNNNDNIMNNTYEYNNSNYNSKKEEINNYNSAKKNIMMKQIYTKIPIIKKTGIKNNKLNSPSQKKINNNHNNNSNYNSEMKDPRINSFNIYSNKINIINNKGIYAKKNLPELKNIKKKLNYTGNKQEEIIRKTPNKKKQKISITPLRQRKLETVKEKYSFTPLINKKSRKIWEKRNKKLEEKYNSSEKGVHSNSNKKYKPQLFEILNNIGAENKEKLNQQDLTEINNIKLIANQKKINLNSYEMAKKGMYKKLDYIIEKYKNEENLSLVNMVQCLYCMRIINELIKIDQIKDLNLKLLKTQINNIKGNDKKKFDELEFIEQFWFKMNPSLEEYIKVDLFSQFIKILFISEKSKIKKYTQDIEKLLLQYKININNNKSSIYIAPLQDKTFEAKDIWTIPKLIKSFLKLKSDLKGYKNVYYELKKEDLKNDLIDDRDKELTFEPDLSQSNNYIFRNAKYKDYNTNKDNLNDSMTDTSRIKKTNFNKIYERFMQEKKMKEEAIKLMREIKKEKEIKKCTLRPKITEYKPRKSHKKNRLNKSVDVNNINNNNKKIPIFERLYSLRKIFNQKKIKLEENEELESKFNSKRSYKYNNKTNSKNKVIKPILEKREIDNYVIKNKNWNNNTNKNVDTNKIYLKKNTKMKVNHFNISKENDNNIIDNISVIMEIKIPNGKSKPFKIYKNQNINDSIEEFCKNNRINKEDKKAIYDQAIYFKNNIFGRNTFENNYMKKNLI